MMNYKPQTLVSIDSVSILYANTIDIQRQRRRQILDGYETLTKRKTKTFTKTCSSQKISKIVQVAKLVNRARKWSKFLNLTMPVELRLDERLRSEQPLNQKFHGIGICE